VRSERELARRFAAGERDALQEIYARYAGPVYTVALSRLRDRELAEDAVQEVFVKAWRATARFDADRQLSPWLYQIARRVAADITRRERRRPATAAPSALHGAVSVTTFGEAWERWQVRCALQELSAEERELVRLTYFEGLTRSEIADRLGIPLGTVKSRVHRAHRRLADKLAHLRCVVA
jgi:RNA polymerase sigma-70 factor (ECF subfamily)